MRQQPLILLTNDDGIDSPGLRAAAEAVLGLGELLVVAPCRQWSGAARCYPNDAPGTIAPQPFVVEGQTIAAFCVDASPAQVVLHAMLTLVPRQPALAVVGINYGENLGMDVTISGTVGAALQAATHGIPALAVSLQTPKETHKNPSADVDFGAARHVTQYFARRILSAPLPFDADILKIDIPASATVETPWRLTRLSRQTYYRAVLPRRNCLAEPVQLDYEAQWDGATLEADSDIHALVIEGIVSVTPLSIDLTSRASMGELEALLGEGVEL